jgi:hypothetical protein
LSNDHAKRHLFPAANCIRVTNTLSLSSFVILCVVTFAIMASAAYAANHMQQGHSQE